MSVNQPKDISTGEEFQIPASRVIKLKPTWSTSTGLIPPLSEEARTTIKEWKAVQDAFIQPQWQAILNDAQDRILPQTTEGIGIRAIMVSTEGSVSLTVGDRVAYEVPDINAVLKRGTELPAGDILVSSQTERDDHIYALSHSRVLQYLINGVNNILNANEPEAKRKLTPAVLIYDLSKLKQSGVYAHIFKNLDEADKAILALYPLDIEPAK